MQEETIALINEQISNRISLIVPQIIEQITNALQNPTATGAAASSQPETPIAIAEVTPAPTALPDHLFNELTVHPTPPEFSRIKTRAWKPYKTENDTQVFTITPTNSEAIRTKEAALPILLWARKARRDRHLDEEALINLFNSIDLLETHLRLEYHIDAVCRPPGFERQPLSRKEAEAILNTKAGNVYEAQREATAIIERRHNSALLASAIRGFTNSSPTPQAPPRATHPTEQPASVGPRRGRQSRPSHYSHQGPAASSGGSTLDE